MMEMFLSVLLYFPTYVRKYLSYAQCAMMRSELSVTDLRLQKLYTSFHFTSHHFTKKVTDAIITYLRRYVDTEL